LKNQSSVHEAICEVRAYMLQYNTALSQATTVSKHERTQQACGKILWWDLIGAGSNFCSLFRTTPYTACCDRQLFDIPITPQPYIQILL
jgi:hypothetical protein